MDANITELLKTVPRKLDNGAAAFRKRYKHALLRRGRATYVEMEGTRVAKVSTCVFQADHEDTDALFAEIEKNLRKHYEKVIYADLPQPIREELAEHVDVSEILEALKW